MIGCGKNRRDLSDSNKTHALIRKNKSSVDFDVGKLSGYYWVCVICRSRHGRLHPDKGPAAKSPFAKKRPQQIENFGWRVWRVLFSQPCRRQQQKQQQLRHHQTLSLR
jgi:hypothetical protein